MEERKNKTQKLLVISIAICLLFIVGLTTCYVYVKYVKTNLVGETKVSLKDDFYESINYETIKNAKIPNDSGSWSKAYDATKIIEERCDELTEEILSDPNYQNENIDNMIELLFDYETRDKLGISELQPYLDMIDESKTIDEFNNVLVALDKDLDVSVVIAYEALNDAYDTSKNVLYFDTIDIIGKSLEMFTNSKYATYVQYFERIMKKYFEVMGYNEEKSNDLVKQLEEFAKTIQSKSLSENDVDDIFDVYNKYTFNEINNEIKNLPIKKLFTALKIDNLEYYIMTDMGHYKALDEYYTEEHLPLLKELAKLQVIDLYFTRTTKENLLFRINLNNEMSGTSITLEDYEKENKTFIKSMYIYDELEKRYEEKYFTDDDKKVVADLVEEVKAYYKEVIKNCDWLSDATKEEAIKKLDNMKVNIGRQETEEEDEEDERVIPKSEGGTLISNSIERNRENFDEFYETFEEAAELSDMSTLEVNASYNPYNNSINFYAGFKELYGNETDYYKLLGYFGFVIGHEISHAFDNTGSKFDENGKVVDWWTEEDRANYDKLTKKIEEYYNNYDIMGFKVDGKQTLGENIADLAAMKAMISIAEAKGATNEDYKKLFEAYADFWVEKINKETAEALVLSDGHSPNNVRVNAVLSSMDKFYEVYDIKETDKMYVPKENRVGLW